MKSILTTLALAITSFASLAQPSAEYMEKARIKLANDILRSFWLPTEEKLQKDWVFDTIYVAEYKPAPDTIYYDTSIHTHFRLTLGKYDVIERDTLYLIDKLFDQEELVYSLPQQPNELFDSTDLVFMYSQLNQKFKWDHRVAVTKVLPYDKISKLLSKNNKRGWEKYYKKYGYDFISLSAPIFNADFTLAIIEVNYWCGFNCATGGAYLCEKINGRWVTTEQIGSAWKR